MAHFLFDQLAFVRKLTLKEAEGIDEAASLLIPAGFGNNIKWNLGHIYLVQERFGFYFTGGEMVMPDAFNDWFGRGSKPADWEGKLPKTDELRVLLKEQTERIKQQTAPLLPYPLKEPFTTSTGLTLSSVEEMLTYSLHHEGLHSETIKSIKRVL
ncbi:DinB family protein [Domibacillus robiginosus]|uniref:DinB family protein n=1 Tax=Domibacillus robiginosus TaxID=1071054 RepID=UPI00067B7E4F|nr:DinB family protein [Domibacillus robiginosus]